MLSLLRPLPTTMALLGRPGGRTMMMLAQPLKKLPKTTVKVRCTQCRTKLFHYAKGGTGSLVKCFEERILKDFTAGDLRCPSCGGEFARPAMIRGAVMCCG